MHRSVLSRSRVAAFSLVEVVMAIGIVSFGLLAIVGLLTTSLSASRAATEDTDLALMAPAVASLLEAQGFDSVSANANYAPGANPAYYFDRNNQLTRDVSGNPATLPDANSLYACTITRCTPAFTQPTANIVLLQLQFTWPLSAPSANRQQRVIFTSVSNHD